MNQFLHTFFILRVILEKKYRHRFGRDVGNLNTALITNSSVAKNFNNDENLTNNQIFLFQRITQYYFLTIQKLKCILLTIKFKQNRLVL